MTLGERIVTVRKNKGITQKDFADRLGISPTRLNYWEKDKRSPPVQMLNKIAEILDVDSDYLIGRKESPEKENSPTPDGTGAGEFTLEQTDRLLVALGLIEEGGQLSDDDLVFVSHIVGLLRAWFRKGK